MLQPFPENVFMKGFLSNFYLRPSCYDCSSRTGKSGSDITIADFWGVQNYYPEFDDDRGVGLVLVNSDKGRKAYEQVNAINLEATYEQALNQNPCIEYSVPRTKHVKTFWDNFSLEGMDAVDDIICKMKPGMIIRFYRKGRHVAKRMVHALLR